MTQYADFISSIRGWTNIRSTTRLSDDVIKSWIAMAEERLNTELRVPEMVYTGTQTLFADSTVLPDDFQQMEFVRPTGHAPYHYITSNQYLEEYYPKAQYYPYDTPSGATDFRHRKRYFTIIGNSMYVIPGVDTVNGTEVELSYYASLAPISDSGVNLVFTKYPRLYTFATLALSAPYLDEDTRAAMWEGETTARIQALNQQHKTTKLGNGPLRTIVKGFG